MKKSGKPSATTDINLFTSPSDERLHNERCAEFYGHYGSISASFSQIELKHKFFYAPQYLKNYSATNLLRMRRHQAIWRNGARHEP
ncbi:hypothetical protein HYPDE_26173 [Hyphomicrobium denitrificans 1NES1]|uniref:Uncharacterized protein n=1 Tax=Hyphomicrobium denitrificans 1NES1 TaxID=670307 RepID=N0B3Z8_9HYPH|nr:hypothetical protein HYPDE_26173 [Hyphomicrobium denitrificans 1NES1]